MALIGVVLDLREPRGADAYDLADFKAVAHLRRLHPGAVEALKRGEGFVHPGFSDREGV